MSVLAIKLFEERDKQPEVSADYLPFVRALFGDKEWNPGVNGDPAVAEAVEDALCALNESNPMGALQWYFMEEYYLHGKSREQIGKEIAENMELLLRDLEMESIRFLRHPANGKPLRDSLSPYQEK